MRLFADPFWVQKAGNQPAEYEDALWPIRPVRPLEERHVFRFAIADGATETSFSCAWANLLVRAVGRGWLFDPEALCDLGRFQAIWKRWVSKKSLPWYAERKVQDGAFSTIIGVTFSESSTDKSGGVWTASAVGDSCLVQVRGEKALVKFPFADASAFNSRPFLLCSRAIGNIGYQNEIRSCSNTWERGDAIYLMTDALACWFMREDEAGHRPWIELNDIAGPEEFADWVSHRRDAVAMRNDDVTLLRIRSW